VLVREIFRIIRRFNEEEGLTILLVEQNATLALEMAHHGYVLETGTVSLDGSSDSLRASAAVRMSYLGRR
jgi:branched-chain amino acid transport system ATP-binding protein